MAQSLINDFQAGKLFFLSRCRNAWYSTWVTHYFAGCMHTTLQSAKEEAEQLRGPGSVFIIHEIPSLIVRTEVGLLAVTEINTQRPLYEYAPIGRLKERRKKMGYGIRPIPRLEMGLSVFKFFRSFYEYHGDYVPLWSSYKDLIFVTGKGAAISVDELPSTRLKAWRSHAQGAEYLLGWDGFLSELKSASVIELIHQAHDPTRRSRPA